MASFLFILEQAFFDHSLRGNPSMVCARNPQSIAAEFAMMPRQNILDGVVESMA